MINSESNQIQNYLAILKRGIWLVAIVFLAGLLITLLLVLLLPSSYESSAVILIEQQEIPAEFVRSTVTSFADQRIQVISQRVMTTTNLKEIIDKYGLYEDERRVNPMELVLEEMREDIQLVPISADVVDPRSGRPTQATIAFSLSYENESPALAQKVANELVSLYLNENLKTRTEAAKETSVFLANETEPARERLTELEARLAEFKSKHADSLPELMTINIELMNRTDREVSDVDRQIQSLRERKIFYESQLAQIQPYNVLYSETGARIHGPADQLKMVQTEYVQVAARYGEKHPDVIKLRKQVEALKEEVDKPRYRDELTARLGNLKAEKAKLKNRYSSTHPDVRKIDAEIAAAETELSESSKNVFSYTDIGDADNPAYIQMRGQLEAVNTELRAISAKRNEFSLKVNDYTTRLSKMPQVEQEYRTLVRDHENETLKYQDLLAKQMEARVSESLETSRKGERFTLIEPPLLPETPAKPNRYAIFFLGLFLALGIGGMAGATSEVLDDRVYGRQSVTALLGKPPIATIPLMSGAKSRAGNRRRFVIGGVFMFIVLAIMLFAIHTLFMPIDVLFFVILRKLGL